MCLRIPQKVDQYTLSPCNELPQHDGRLFWATRPGSSSATQFIFCGVGKTISRKIFPTMLVAACIYICVYIVVDKDLSQTLDLIQCSYDFKGSLTVWALYAYFSDSQNAAFELLVWCM